MAFINFINISDFCTPVDVRDIISQYPYWMQMNISEILTIPDVNPDIDHINDANIAVNIIKQSIIKVPISKLDNAGNYIPNLEKKISTGRKLIIEGELQQSLIYTATDPAQSLYTVDFYIPFSSYIMVPSTIEFNNGQTVIDSLNVNFQINSCIENAFIGTIDLRSFSEQVTLLLYSVPNQ